MRSTAPATRWRRSPTSTSRRRTATARRTAAPSPRLGPDAARGDERIRAQFGAGVRGYLARLEDMLGSREDAVVALSSMVGALLLSRAVDDAELSEEFLARRAGGGGYGEVTGASAGSAAMSQLPTRLTAIIAATAAAGAAGAAIANAAGNGSATTRLLPRTSRRPREVRAAADPVPARPR